MEIVLGFLISLLTQLAKFLSEKYGKKMSARVVHLIVFTCSMAVTSLLAANVVSMATFESLISVMAVAVTAYEMVIKRVLVK